MNAAHEYRDDLGDLDGINMLPYADEAREHTLNWSVAAVGHRPVDHAQRDLLIGGWLRDGRCYQFRKLLKNRDPRFYAETDELPPGDQLRVVHARAFSFLHSHALFSRFDSGFCTDAAGKVIRAVLNCPPTMVMLNDEDVPAVYLRPCNRPRLCPYCLSRTAAMVYRHLRPRYEPGSNRVLGLLTLAAATHHLQLDNDLSREEVRRAVTTCRTHLRRLAASLGMSGGLVSLDIGPHLSQSTHWDQGQLIGDFHRGLEIRVCLLGEIPSTHLPTLRSTIASLAGVRFGDTVVEPRLTVRTTASSRRDALRSMLFGDWPRRPPPTTPEETDIDRAEGAAQVRQNHPAPVFGVFSYAPWYIAECKQWFDYMELTYRLPLYKLWGSWEPPVRTVNRWQNAPERLRRQRSRQNLVVANCRRHADKSQRIDEMENAIRSIYQSFIETYGKEPGRTMLQRAAENSGIIISERQARALITRWSRQTIPS